MRLFFCIFLCTGLWFQAEGQKFELPDNYPVGDSPIRIVSADFNNDGLLDIVSCNYPSASVSVLMGQPGGKFIKGGDFMPSPKFYDIKALDINKDKKMDLLIIGDQIQVWKGYGDGTFSYGTSENTSSAYTGITGDFNQDGWDDVAVTNIFHDNISVFYGSNTGNFSSVQDFAVGDQPSYIDKGDFNEDSFLDLAIANHRSDQLSILLNNKSGGFLPAIHYDVDSFPNGMAISDLNGDKHLDIAVACINNDFSITILIGNGKGAFPTIEHTGYGAVAANVVAQDFTCDGKIDLMLANARLNLIEMIDGNFVTTDNFFVNIHPYSIIAADFDQDGGFDIAIPNSPYGKVTVVRNIAGCRTNLPSEPVPEPALSIPNIFTPNGDTFNQVFFIRNLNKFPANQLEIYNRWGKLVYVKKDYQNDWDGQGLPAGVYYYSLKLYQTKQFYKGWITLVR